MVEITPRRLQLKLKKRDLKGRCYQDGCSQNQFARLFTSILTTQQQQLPSGCCSCTYCMWEKHCYVTVVTFLNVTHVTCALDVFDTE